MFSRMLFKTLFRKRGLLMIKPVDKKKFVKYYKKSLPKALIVLIRKIDEIILQVNKNTKAVKKT